MTRTLDLDCRDRSRRDLVRAAAGVYGLDYVEVAANDPTKLLVFFIGRAPARIGTEHLRVEGGRRVRDIAVTDVVVDRDDHSELDDRMLVTVDKVGDRSTYTLRVVDVDANGVERRREDFDRRYDRVEFTFHADCPSELDCLATTSCPPPPRPEPEISYLAKDYASFRQLLLDRMALLVPDWRERHLPDLGMTLVELLAYAGDSLSYYQDAVATEAYLDTARRRISVRRHARMVDYRVHEGCNARAWVCLRTRDEISRDARELFFATAENDDSGLRALSNDDRDRAESNGFQIFEALLPRPGTKLNARPAHNEIPFHTWGDSECCLPRGATRATLRDTWVFPAPAGGSANPDVTTHPGPAPKPARALRLQRGDFLVFEEVKSPTTGLEADADPTHRWVVRLTKVKARVDRLVPWPREGPTAALDTTAPAARGTPVLDIEWSEEDRLPFSLCISAIGGGPECSAFHHVSVARGNVLLVDHGATVSDPTRRVPIVEGSTCCEAEGMASESELRAGDFPYRLERRPLTHQEPVRSGDPASRLLDQDPRAALPCAWLSSRTDASHGDLLEHWNARHDLLDSGPGERDFVVEIDDEGFANIRFGNDDLGRSPDAGAEFTATYRIGNGPAGNVGAGAICRVGFSMNPDAGLRVTNPLPARGGTAFEPVAEAKLLAPHEFRNRLERAITAGDYARLAERDSRRADRRNTRLQAAAATLRWTGSWYEALVALDPVADLVDVEALLDEVANALEGYRRVGHDVRVERAREVPLHVRLCVVVKPHYLRGHVEAALRDVFGTGVLPDGRLGFFHPDRSSFGEGVYVSQILAAAQAVAGVESVSVTALERQFEGPNGEVLDGVLPLGPLEVARLDNDPDEPENGTLTLQIEGGR